MDLRQDLTLVFKGQARITHATDDARTSNSRTEPVNAVVTVDRGSVHVTIAPAKGRKEIKVTDLLTAVTLDGLKVQVQQLIEGALSPKGQETVDELIGTWTTA